MSNSREWSVPLTRHSAAWESLANLERQLAESPVDTEQIVRLTLLLVGSWRPAGDLTKGIAEDARCIRADWERVGEDLRKAVARTCDEFRLEGAVG